MSVGCVEETYTVYTRTLTKARKEHACSACKETIRPGDYYTKVFSLYDGNTNNYKRCPACEAIFDELVSRLQENEQWPDERLNCGHEWSENFGEPPPEHIAALAFLSPAEKQAIPALAALDFFAQLVRHAARRDGVLTTASAAS
jgi:hypothetical protein